LRGAQRRSNPDIIDVQFLDSFASLAITTRLDRPKIITLSQDERAKLKSPAQTPGFRPPNQKTSGKRKTPATGPAKLISP
jgi:hypothetical protein